MQPVLDSRNKIIDRMKYNHPLSIEQELDQAAAVITFNSAVAVEATIRGIPVIGQRPKKANALDYLDLGCCRLEMPKEQEQE